MKKDFFNKSLNKILKKYDKYSSKILNSNKYTSKFVKKLEKTTKEKKLLYFFGVLFFIIFIRLFQLQIVQAQDYEKRLISQHSSHTTLEARRWNIFVTDKSWNYRQLTENIDIYTIFVDPWLIKDQNRFVEKLTPVIYSHFCENYWLERLNIENSSDKLLCVRNIETFSQTKILPEQDNNFIISWESENIFLDEQAYISTLEKVLDWFTKDNALSLISSRLMDMTKSWTRPSNYFWFFEDAKLLSDLEALNQQFIFIQWNYLYFVPDRVSNINFASRLIHEVFENNWYNYTQDTIAATLRPRDIRYVRVTTNVSWQIIREIREMKNEYFFERTEWVPLLHWLWYEQSQKRFYPYWTFMSHILWYLNNEWAAFYWVEEYFDQLLKWKNWQMVWLSVPWIWMIWSNNIEIQPAIDGVDLYLTIDPTIQENVELIARTYFNEFRADSLSIIVMDPHTWEIKASVNYPNFDPNFYWDYYKIKPLSYDERYIIDYDHYLDIPVLVFDEEWDLKIATYDERKDPNLRKYIFNNRLWPQVFVDKNIAYPSEPWSTFKSVTVAIWVDADEISLYDFYRDEWSVQVWPYRISNVMSQCRWNNTFLHALDWSCNVWMVRIVQRVQRYVFYSYLDKLWFWRITWIELAQEESWTVSWLEDFSLARFFNNSFWQWLLITPVQLAVAYSAMVNWWYIVNPTVVDKIYDPATWEFIYYEPKLWQRVFSEETSAKMLKALWDIMDMEDEEHLWSMVWIPFYSLWWKSWTSQLAFRWRYMAWIGWTNGWFAWVTTSEDPRYVIISQVRRPRQSQRWWATAWFLNRDVSKFLIEYSGIQK